MRRGVLLGLLVCVCAVGAWAQLGKKPAFVAGTPEDRAFQAIEQEADLNKRIELLEKFVQEFTGDARLVGHQRLQLAYLRLAQEEADAAKKTEWLDKSLLNGLQAQRLDPTDFSTLVNLSRAFADKQDAAQAFNYGLLAVRLVERLKTMPPPEGTSAEVWENQKAALLEQAQGDYQYLEYALYQIAFQQSDAATQGGFFERYVEAFTDSRYRAGAYQGCISAYQRAGAADKIAAVGENALERDANPVVVTLLATDALSEMGQELDRAEALAQKLPALIEAAAKGENQSEEQFAQQKNTWKGLAHSILGQILMHREKTAEAIAAFREAEPLLAGEALAQARNLYRLGFAYAKLGRLDPARRYLQQAAAIESPYKTAAEELLKKVEEARAKRPQ